MTEDREAGRRAESSLYHDRTVRAIRRIIRAVDIFSRKLHAIQGVTVPQLSCLVHLVKVGPLTLSSLAQKADLSASTAVGIVDRLEGKGLVTRTRSRIDRRQVVIAPTAAAITLLDAAPSPLQDRLAAALETLPESEQAALTRSLERIVHLMGIEEVEAAPILDTGVSLTTDPDAPATDESRRGGPVARAVRGHSHRVAAPPSPEAPPTRSTATARSAKKLSRRRYR